MFCNKCGTQMATNEQFCPVCGERADMQREKGEIKPRKQYNTVIYVLLFCIFGLGAFLGINDLYAGFIKRGLLRALSTIVGVVLLMVGLMTQVYVLGYVGAGLVILAILTGVWALFWLSQKAYRLENGQAVMIRELDMRLDRKGVEQYLINTYGCGLKG